jgi:hypothetical protein
VGNRDGNTGFSSQRGAVIGRVAKGVKQRGIAWAIIPDLTEDGGKPIFRSRYRKGREMAKNHLKRIHQMTFQDWEKAFPDERSCQA